MEYVDGRNSLRNPTQKSPAQSCQAGDKLGLEFNNSAIYSDYIIDNVATVKPELSFTGD